MSEHEDYEKRGLMPASREQVHRHEAMVAAAVARTWPEMDQLMVAQGVAAMFGYTYDSEECRSKGIGNMMAAAHNPAIAYQSMRQLTQMLTLAIENLVVSTKVADELAHVVVGQMDAPDEIRGQLVTRTIEMVTQHVNEDHQPELVKGFDDASHQLADVLVQRIGVAVAAMDMLDPVEIDTEFDLSDDQYDGYMPEQMADMWQVPDGGYTTSDMTEAVPDGDA